MIFSCLLSLLITSQELSFQKVSAKGKFLCLKTKGERKRRGEGSRIRLSLNSIVSASFFLASPSSYTVSIYLPLSPCPPPSPPPFPLVSSFVSLTSLSSLVVLLRDRQRCYVAASRSSAGIGRMWDPPSSSRLRPAQENKVCCRACNPPILNPKVWADFLSTNYCELLPGVKTLDLIGCWIAALMALLSSYVVAILKYNENMTFLTVRRNLFSYFVKCDNCEKYFCQKHKEMPGFQTKYSPLRVLFEKRQVKHLIISHQKQHVTNF